MTPTQQLRKFHETFGVDKMDFNNKEHRMFRLALMEEEFEEFKKAMIEGDEVLALDGAVDMNVISYGTGDVFGWDMEGAMYECYASNMSKLDENGKPLINGVNCPLDETRPKGKILKSTQFFEPDFSQFLPDSLGECLKEF